MSRRPKMRRTNADRAAALIEWGMLRGNRGREFTKAEMGAAIGMGAGVGFDRVLGAARELCNERGHNFGYFHPCTDGKWRAAFTKTDPKLPLPGAAQRMTAIAGQTKNVRKQVTFVEQHSGHDDVARHVAKIVEMAEANTIEVNAILRSVLDRLSEDDD